MTPEERKLVLSLVSTPGAGKRAVPGAVLRELGAVDGAALGVEVLRDSIARKDPVDLEMAVILANTFGVTVEYVSPLISATYAEWHVKHEDVVTLLGRLRDEDAIPALEHAARWTPEYLAYDGGESLTSKAVRALSAVPGKAADAALRSLVTDGSQVAQDQARKALARR